MPSPLRTSSTISNIPEQVAPVAAEVSNKPKTLTMPSPLRTSSIISNIPEQVAPPAAVGFSNKPKKTPTEVLAELARIKNTKISNNPFMQQDKTNATPIKRNFAPMRSSDKNVDDTRGRPRQQIHSTTSNLATNPFIVQDKEKRSNSQETSSRSARSTQARDTSVNVQTRKIGNNPFIKDDLQVRSESRERASQDIATNVVEQRGRTTRQNPATQPKVAQSNSQNFSSTRSSSQNRAQNVVSNVSMSSTAKPVDENKNIGSFLKKKPDSPSRFIFPDITTKAPPTTTTTTPPVRSTSQDRFTIGRRSNIVTNRTTSQDKTSRNVVCSSMSMDSFKNIDPTTAMSTGSVQNPFIQSQAIFSTTDSRRFPTPPVPPVKVSSPISSMIHENERKSTILRTPSVSPIKNATPYSLRDMQESKTSFDDFASTPITRKPPISPSRMGSNISQNVSSKMSTESLQKYSNMEK
jgi:hypothetical protein